MDHDFETIEKQAEACGYFPIQRKGHGTYGVVYEVGNETGEIFALKYIRLDSNYQNYGLDNLNEIDILCRVDHPYIIHAVKVITPHSHQVDGVALVLPLAERTLFDLIKDPKVTTDEKIPIFYKIATSIDFLHSNNILHLDIKASNVVLQCLDKNHPYVIDFGLSLIVDDTFVGKSDPSTRVTIDHRAPEILAGSNVYNSAVDIWAYGIMMLYVLGGINIFYRSAIDFSSAPPYLVHQAVTSTFSDTDIFDDLLKGVRPQYLPLCKDLLSRILKLNPTERLTAKQICDHPLFDTCRFPVSGNLIHDVPIPHDNSDDHRDIVKIIIHWSKLIFPQSSTELLFLAVDLFNRTSSFYKTRSPLDRMTLASTCLWMSSKITNDYFIPLDKYISSVTSVVEKITSPSILDTELEIIFLLNGVLNVSKLYRACKTADHLRLSLHYVILSRDHSTYAQTDIPAWLDVMDNYIQETSQSDLVSSKFLTISDLLEQ